ncbi:unnamed protein product [Durusdinium trenchii]|uniref:JmjC domain-containing protein n=2 Tax=Durusdinium trenchii TaxID=1381693 RepID=A0ABP0NYQ9_9DINO
MAAPTSAKASSAFGPRPLQSLPELTKPFRSFAGYAEQCKPCVLRGLASPPTTELSAKLHTLQRRCTVSFEPTRNLFHFDVEVDSADGGRRRLINPGRISMHFQDFWETCRRASAVASAASAPSVQSDGRTARVVNMPYDTEDLPEPANPEEPQVLEVSLEELKNLALYCVEDAGDWADLLQDVHPVDPAALIHPEWQRLLRERRIWMSSGGPQGTQSVSAGFHWDHLQNIHVVLSGSKEVFLVAPLLAPALCATRFCPQSQWQMSSSGGRMRVEKVEMQSAASSTDYGLISVDSSYEENLQRHHRMAIEMKEQPFWVSLQPGDAIFIPPGWWHSIRTFRPDSRSDGLPFALSMNFWYELSAEAKAAQSAVLMTLEILSRQRAVAGVPEEHIKELLERLGVDEVEMDEDRPSHFEKVD